MQDWYPPPAYFGSIISGEKAVVFMHEENRPEAPKKLPTFWFGEQPSAQ